MKDDALVELPTDSLIKELCDAVVTLAQGNEASLAAIGIALPGMIRNGIVEEAPTLPQLKGARIADLIKEGLASNRITAPISVLNDADAVAAGLASLHGKLDRLIRVWTLGIGIGYGRYPFADGIWEGGHQVVSLDEKERFCGCGGIGHLEGIMGHRAMRLRFLRSRARRSFRCRPTRATATHAASNSRSSGTNRLRRSRPTPSTWMAPASSSSPASTSVSST